MADQQGVTRKLAAILYADVAGYSRLTGADEEGTHRTVANYLDAISGLVEGHGGRVVHYAGDAVLADFASVVAAVKCAIEIQKELGARNANIPNDHRVQFRIGVNLGDVIVDRDDIYGNGVNVAARLESLADAGGICVSQKVLDEVEGKIDIGFDDMGPQEVKNIAKPVQAYRVVLEKPSSVVQPPPLPEKPSIAVLPFTNLSGDPEQDFFSDGLAGDIITELSRFRSLFVIARNSSFTYKGRAVDLKAVARDLGVRYVLEGSVRKAGRRIRVTGELIDAETGSHIWAERYDRNLDDLFAIQDEITNAIVATIEPEIGAAERERALRKAPETLDAWGLYQKGLAAFYSATVEGYQTAIGLFDRVNAMDPNFALAFAMGADARCGFIRHWNPDQSEALLMEAAEKAQQAIALAPRESLCLAVDARVCLLQGQLDLAVAKARQSVALNPNDAAAHWMLGVALTGVQKPQEALENFDRALRLSPNNAYVARFQNARAMALFQLERYEEAVEWVQRSVHAAPRPLDFGILVACLSQLGRMDEAKAVLEQLYKRQPNFSTTSIGTLRTLLGPRFSEAMHKAGVPE